jgi:NhaP-type Na+/H+ or K+/H+ antiporter
MLMDAWAWCRTWYRTHVTIGFGCNIPSPCSKTNSTTLYYPQVWGILVWICDTVVFILAGAVIMRDGYLDYAHYLESKGMFKAFVTDWGYLFALYAWLHVARAIMVLVCAPFIRYTGYGMQPRVLSNVDFWKNMFVLTWGGLRGAVGLVLAMIVARDTHLAHAVNSDPLYGLRVLTFVSGIVVLTTWLNAMSLEPLILWTGLATVTAEDKRLQKSAKTYLRKKQSEVMAALRNRHHHPELANVDWQEVERQVGATFLH